MPNPEWNYAKIYDRVAGEVRHYPQEAKYIWDCFTKNHAGPGNKLLDLGCGTGSHVQQLSQYFNTQGLDISHKYLEVAQAKNPGVTFHEQSFVNFELGETFDAITCLYGAITFALTKSDLLNTFASAYKHFNPGGLLMLEPWLYSEIVLPNIGKPFTLVHKEEGLAIMLMYVNELANKGEGPIVTMPFHFMVGVKNEKVHTFTEEIVYRLRPNSEYIDAMQQAGFTTKYDDVGPANRGLIIGIK
jgi:SAM-dependent methyltransferase